MARQKFVERSEEYQISASRASSIDVSVMQKISIYSLLFFVSFRQIKKARDEVIFIAISILDEPLISSGNDYSGRGTDLRSFLRKI